MEKRALANFLKHWPGIQVSVTSPQITFEDYTNHLINQEMLINTMAGDFQGLMIYPRLGYQIELPISSEALAAYDFLVTHDFTKQMV